jgi:GrpB-like predicted nucleotidyltransferase (UPF0157 family)
MSESPVEIVDYDPAWPNLFLLERNTITAALGRWMTGFRTLETQYRNDREAYTNAKAPFVQRVLRSAHNESVQVRGGGMPSTRK